LNELLSDILDAGKVDFAALPSTIQGHVLEAAQAEPAARERIRALNPWIGEALACRADTSQALISHNADVVRRSYSLAACGGRLSRLYQTVAASRRTPPEPLANGSAVLDSFLDLRRLNPVRIEA
jgi:hypothetical protein